MINKRVKINCPVYNNSKTHFGIVKSIKKQTNTYTTYMVLIDGNKKCTAFDGGWLKLI